MALVHISIEFDVDEAAINSLATDVAASPATYGSLIRLPGIKSVTATADILEKELYGDAGVIDYRTKVRKWTGTATLGQHNLDVAPVLIGGTVTDAGTTPNQIASYVHALADQASFFKLRFRTKAQSFLATNTSDIVRTFFKCRATSFSEGATEEDYGLPQMNFTAIVLIGNATINGVSNTRPSYAKEYRETAAVLA